MHSHRQTRREERHNEHTLDVPHEHSEPMKLIFSDRLCYVEMRRNVILWVLRKMAQ
jgi:hypothetical protein